MTVTTILMLERSCYLRKAAFLVGLIQKLNSIFSRQLISSLTDSDSLKPKEVTRHLFLEMHFLPLFSPFLPFSLFPLIKVAAQIQLRDLGDCCKLPPLHQRGRQVPWVLMHQKCVCGLTRERVWRLQMSPYFC